MTDLFSPLVERAIELSAEWHDQTYRKSRWREYVYDPPPETALQIPVMAHVTAVALMVQRAGWDDATVAAAFLHDVIEDRNRFRDTLTVERLTALMGEAVVQRVLAVTEPKHDAHGAALPWRVRKDAYLAGLRGATPEAAAISLADKLHNAWTMNQALEAGLDIFTDGPAHRGLTAGPAEQLWFFESVLAASASHDDPRLEPMRARLIEEVTRFERLVSNEG